MVNNECINNDCDVHVPPIKSRLWIIEFEVRHAGSGCAVVKAGNPELAARVLKSEGIYNGSPKDYIIKRIEEIIESPETMLLAEQVVRYKDPVHIKAKRKTHRITYE